MATRYWVGGTGTWDSTSTTHWSTTSGGASGASAPTSADTVIFDSLSGTGTCTTAATAAASVVTLNSSTLGLTLGANFTMSGTFTLTLGTLSLVSYTLSCSIFSSSNSNARSVAFGTGNITLTGSSASIYFASTGTNLTYTGTPVFNCTYSGSTGTRTISSPSTDPSINNSASFNITAGTDTISFGTSTVRVTTDVNFTGFSGTCSELPKKLYGNLTLVAGMTLSGTTGQTITFAATSGTKTITTAGKTIDNPITFDGVGGTWQLQDNLAVSSTRTVALNNGTLNINNNTLSCGLFNTLTDNVRAIAFGTGNITITGNNATVFNAGNNTNLATLTLTGTPKVYLTYSGATGTRTVAGGPRDANTEAQTFSIYVTAGTDIVNFTNATSYKTIDFTGFSGSWDKGAITMYGDLTFSSTMSFTGNYNTITLKSVLNQQTITSNGLTVDTSLRFENTNSSGVVFADALTQNSLRTFQVASGIVKLKSGVTTTVGSFQTPANTTQRYLQSTVAGSRATLSQASGTVSVSYLTIKDIAATGGATWNAYRNLNNIDAGNNTGWDFLSTPVTTTTLSMRLGFGL